MRLCIRLKEDEAEQLKKMAASEITGTENTSEFIRLLLAREWNRRKGQAKPNGKQYQTAFRVGRPANMSRRKTKADGIENSSRKTHSDAGLDQMTEHEWPGECQPG
jgi:hypothetical protein